MTWLEWIEAWPTAVLLKNSGTLYLLVNAAHILGISLLVGAILPLDLRLVGLLRSVPLQEVGPFLSRVAQTGLALAIVTGLWLFTVNAKEYVGNPAFLSKLGLLGFALVMIVAQHWGTSLRNAFATGIVPARVATLAAMSGAVWIAVLIAGRWIGFV